MLTLNAYVAGNLRKLKPGGKIIIIFYTLVRVPEVGDKN